MRASLWRMCLVLMGLAVTLSSASCGSSSDNPTACAGSSFTGTVKSAGGVTLATLSGTACWSLTGTLDWALGLNDASGLSRVVVGREFGGPPTSNQTYPLNAVGAGNLDFGLRAQFGIASLGYVCSTAADGTIHFTVVDPPRVNGSISVPLLCSTAGGQTLYVQLDVSSFVATEGDVTLIP